MIEESEKKPQSVYKTKLIEEVFKSKDFKGEHYVNGSKELTEFLNNNPQIEFLQVIPYVYQSTLGFMNQDWVLLYKEKK